MPRVGDCRAFGCQLIPVWKGTSGERSKPGRGACGEPGFQARAAHGERQRRADPPRPRTAGRRAARPRDNPSAVAASAVLRFSRCCRSAKPADPPSRMTSSSPSSVTSPGGAIDDVGKRRRHLIARARIEPQPRSLAHDLHPGAVPFPLGHEIGGVQPGRSSTSRGWASMGGRKAARPVASGRGPLPSSQAKSSR